MYVVMLYDIVPYAMVLHTFIKWKSNVLYDSIFQDMYMYKKNYTLSYYMILNHIIIALGNMLHYCIVLYDITLFCVICYDKNNELGQHNFVSYNYTCKWD